MQRRGLGKGLSALIPAATVRSPQPSISEATSVDVSASLGVRNLEVEKIHPNPKQPRVSFDEGELMELTESIRQHGILQPIIVRPVGDEYEIIAGERRWRAAQRAGLTAIPALVKESDDQESLEMSLIENLQREDITPIEAAKAYQRLVREFGMTQQEIAKRVGKSRPAIANTLRLLELPEAVQVALSERKISEGHARALLALPDMTLAEAICKEIAQRNLSVRQVEQLVKKVSKGQRQRKSGDSRFSDEKDPNLLAVETRLQERMQTKVTIRPSPSPKGSGTILVEYYSPEEFERIVAEMMK